MTKKKQTLPVQAQILTTPEPTTMTAEDLAPGMVATVVSESGAAFLMHACDAAITLYGYLSGDVDAEWISDFLPDADVRAIAGDT